MSDPNRYVGSVRLNGRPLRRGYIRHDELLAGGTLEFPHVADANSEMGHRYE
ncbi:glycoside hydrolase domain-containing protein [uncultured Sphingomonas sp.]|uniref:glycoside hydrolase domain-containing protein n=1 Tax=uncultured Sphingomonas sp. TaxID=158754 RepID=UPI0025D943F0|nr:glycoside hydrolase domain-containing protein [uncultured Sphingomonas sp.]